MKHFLLAAVAATAFTMPVICQNTVKTLYSGDPVDVTWENTLKIESTSFDEDINVGDYIYITFDQTSDVIELKANGTWLPGTRFTSLGDNTPDMKTYITADMLNSLKAYGLELCGAAFTVKEVSICNDGFHMPDGAIWGGYFWVDNWNTLELFKTAFDNYDGERYLDIYLSDDNGDNTGYFMKVLTAWDNPDAVWADNSAITHEAKKAVVDLKDIDVKAKLAEVNTLMIQSNPEGGSPYNITAIALRSDEGTTGINNIEDSVNYQTTVIVYNLQGMPVMTAATVDEALSDLPSGIYIINGKKFMR